jgi:hypothetical protein
LKKGAREKGAVSEFKAKTPYGEMTVDQLAGIQPGMATLMKEVGERYTQTYYAAKGGNWKLAAHHLNGLRSAFRTAKLTRPKFADDLAAYDKEYLTPIFRAIHDQDWKEFEAAFGRGESGSDFYHDKRGYPHIRYVLPDDPTSNLYLGPPEEFRRKAGAKGPS